jgi:DNA helicase-2/ATP-dependent DNA helicase PcrA
MFKGVGEVTIGKLEDIAKKENKNIIEVCKDIEKYTNKISIKALAQKIKETMSIDYKKNNVGDCLNFMVEKIGYKDLLQKNNPDDYIDRIDNVMELINNATSYSGSIEKYLQNLELISSSDEKDEEGKVHLMSGHCSKGQEREVIFCVGLEHNVLPCSQALASEDREKAVQEERRVFFVMASRAKKRLYISWNKSRKFRGSNGFLQTKICQPSQFLIESGLLKKK